MNTIKTTLNAAIFSLLVLCLPAIAAAQYGNGPYYPNGNNRNGGYGNNGYYGDIRSVIRDLKDRSKDLQRGIDRDLDQSRMNGSRREDDINRLAKDFRDAAGRLKESSYDRQDDRLQRVVELGYELERSIGRVRMSYETENAWMAVRSDLQVLGGNGYYNGYPNNNRNNRNNYPNYPNNNRNGGWGNIRRPSWWPF